MRDDDDVMVIEAQSSGFRWFLVGAVVGAACGMLFAPQAGQRTRRDLARKGRKLRARAEETIEDLGDELQTRGRRIKETVREFADEVLEDAEEGGRRVERSASDAREEMARRLADARARARAAAAVDAAGDDDESD